jgi:hypothetical protein
VSRQELLPSLTSPAYHLPSYRPVLRPVALPVLANYLVHALLMHCCTLCQTSIFFTALLILLTYPSTNNQS